MWTLADGGGVDMADEGAVGIAYGGGVGTSERCRVDT